MTVHELMALAEQGMILTEEEHAIIQAYLISVKGV